jgi:tripartite-type tricarboxylate transporter receptor subunit TctC
MVSDPRSLSDGLRIVFAVFESRPPGGVVENKCGANGNIGLETAARSAADGYTVLVAPDAVSSNPHVYKMNVDPLKGLTPVIQLSRQPIVLAAHSSLGIASLAELIVLARCLDENNSKGRAPI